MRSRAWGSGALTATRAEEGSALVRPTRNSSTSNWPPSSTTRSKTFLRMSESIRCPSRRTVSWTIIDPQSELRKGQTLLRLVFALLVGVGRLADLVALEEEHLRDPFPGVDPGGQGGRVRDLEGHDPLPLRLERGHVHDDAAARIGRFPKTNCDHVPRDAEVLDRAGEGEGVGGDDADLALEVHEGAGVEVLGIHDRGVDVREDLELVGDAHVVAVGGEPVGDHALPDLLLGEGLDHPMLERHPPDPPVGLDRHRPHLVIKPGGAAIAPPGPLAHFAGVDPAPFAVRCKMPRISREAPVRQLGYRGRATRRSRSPRGSRRPRPAAGGASALSSWAARAWRGSREGTWRNIPPARPPSPLSRESWPRARYPSTQP